MSQFHISERIINRPTPKGVSGLRVEASQTNRASPLLRADHNQLTARKSPHPEFVTSKTGS